MTSGNATTKPRRCRPLPTWLLLTTLMLPAWAAAQATETLQPLRRADQSRDPAPPVAARGRGVDADWILHRLTRPPPQSTPFVELRLSATLRRPLVVSGEYRRPDGDTLVREVRAPYEEVTTIRDGQAVVARSGRAPRTASLDRVPELAALHGSFGALLSGDRKQLESLYAVQADGVPADWTLTLTPRDARTAGRILAVVLRGRDDELRCIETRPARGESQPTLLGGAATDVGGLASLDDALRLCHDVPR